MRFPLSGATWRRTDDFLQVTGPCNLSFPADHGPHIGLPHGMVVLHRQSDGRRQPSLWLPADLFPQRAATARQGSSGRIPASAWRTDQVYLAHAAITDIDGGRHLQAETMARPVLSMAGAEQAGTAW
jgi:predicted secreted hydrolase